MCQRLCTCALSSRGDCRWFITTLTHCCAARTVYTCACVCWIEFTTTATRLALHEVAWCTIQRCRGHTKHQVPPNTCSQHSTLLHLPPLLPTVGDDNWRLYYGTQIPNNYRITHNADPVPHLPPELFGFHHTATEVWYNELETHYHVCDGSGEDKAGADGVIFPLLITDHLTCKHVPWLGVLALLQHRVVLG